MSKREGKVQRLCELVRSTSSIVGCKELDDALRVCDELSPPAPEPTLPYRSEKHERGHVAVWRISTNDKADDRVATCYSEENATLVLDALNRPLHADADELRERVKMLEDSLTNVARYAVVGTHFDAPMCGEAIVVRDRIAELERRNEHLNEMMHEELFAKIKLEDAIREHHAQRADDRCWLDDVELYKAAGLSVPDDLNYVGDREEMRKNCDRFIENRCADGGPWKSYAELQAEIAALRVHLADANRGAQRNAHANRKLAEELAARPDAGLLADVERNLKFQHARLVRYGHKYTVRFGEIESLLSRVRAAQASVPKPVVYEDWIEQIRNAIEWFVGHQDFESAAKLRELVDEMKRADVRSDPVKGGE